MSAPPDFPKFLRRSFAVDLAQLEAGVRAVIRSELHHAGDAAKLRAWARRRGFFVATGSEGFFALSRSPSAARRVLRIDSWPGRHVVALGHALGYPPCCCRAAARAGEERIDEWSSTVSRRRFVGPYALIDPGGYREGKTRISHVPCSPRCRTSLRLAIAVGECRGRPATRGMRASNLTWGL